MHSLLLLLLLLTPLPALALTPAELVTPDLDARPVTVTGLHRDELAYFDADRRLRREPAGGYVRLRLDPRRAGEAAAAPDALLTLTDGQRLAGDWAGAEDEGQTLRWVHPVLGELRLPLDRIAAIRFAPDAGPAHQAAPAAPADPAAAQDRVVLLNGDTIAGFVPSLATAEGGVPIDHAGQRVVIPRERLRALRLANPPAPAPAVAGRHLVRFRDGSRVLATGLSITGDRALLTPTLNLSGTPLDLAVDDLDGIDFVGAGWRLVDLADQPLRVRSGGRVFGLALPPAWEAGGLRLHAPVALAFTLPPGAVRAAALAELDLAGVPRGLHDWADLLVTFGQGAEPQRLGPDRPTLRLNTEAIEGDLPLTLDAGVNGPILDRVRLRDAVILLREPVSESAEGSAGVP